jgi:CHAT domain-containing protein/tetratricopeptide (TPR) repeat protein
MIRQTLQLYEAGQYDKATELAHRQLSFAERYFGRDHLNVGTCLLDLALLDQAQGRYAEAEPLYKRALAIFEKKWGPNHPQMASLLNNLAALYDTQGRYAEAESLLKRSLAIREKALGRDHIHVGQSLNNLAELYREQGRYAEAEPLYKRALVIREKAPNPDHVDIGDPLENLGLLYYLQERYAEAEALYKRALATREKAKGPDHPETARPLNNIAYLYLEQGRYAEAEPLLRRARVISEKALGPDGPEVATILNGFGRLYFAQGRYAEAEPLLKRALAIRETALGRDHPYVAGVFGSLAEFALAQRDWAQAADYWRRATAIIERRTERGHTGPEEGSAKAVGSSQYFSGLVKMTDRLPTGTEVDSAKRAAEMFEAAQWAEGSEAAGSLAQMAARSAKDDAGLAGLARERQDLVGEWQAKDKQLIAAKTEPPAKRNTEVEKSLSDRLAAIDARLATIDAQLAKDFPEYASLSRPKPASVSDVQALLASDEALILLFDTPEFKPTVPEETFIWVITKTKMRWVKSALGTNALTERVTALRCGLDPSSWDDEKGRTRCHGLVGADPQNKGLPFDLAKAHELYEALFGSIKQEITGKRLMIVASGPLAKLPFGVLVTEKPSEALPKTVDGYRGIAWLGVRSAVTVLPSVSGLYALRRLAKGGRAPEPFIGFGDPTLRGSAGCTAAVLPTACPGAPGGIGQRIASIFSPTGASAHRAVTRAPVQSFFKGDLANIDVLQAQCPLPETAFELKCVAQSLGVPESQIQMREKATETAAKKAPLDRYQIVYFATHGLLASETKRATGSLAEPALMLTPPQTPSEADDGLLTASEIAQLKLNADWVVMSACNTAGAADTQSGEALSGLARAFFYAGARALLVSHWAVDSDAAVLLTTRTFAELKSNPTIGRAEALRRAMQAIVEDKGRPDAAHPSFWAPFVVVGEGAAR